MFWFKSVSSGQLRTMEHFLILTYGSFCFEGCWPMCKQWIAFCLGAALPSSGDEVVHPHWKWKCHPSPDNVQLSTCAHLDIVSHKTTTTTARRAPTFTVHDKQHNRFCISSKSEGYRKVPEDGTWMPKLVGTWEIYKGVINNECECWSVISTRMSKFNLIVMFSHQYRIKTLTGRVCILLLHCETNTYYNGHGYFTLEMKSLTI
jgi:hypothetical protein